MARGTSTRAPSQNAYRGGVGQTQSEVVHVTSSRGDLIAGTVHTTIDAVASPDLVEKLHAGTLNTVSVDGAESIVGTPIAYHDPAAEVFVLVLAEAHRHRELDERIRLLERPRAGRAAVPAYVKDFAVVFGSSGLRADLEQKAHQVLPPRDSSRDQGRKPPAGDTKQGRKLRGRRLGLDGRGGRSAGAAAQRGRLGGRGSCQCSCSLPAAPRPQAARAAAQGGLVASPRPAGHGDGAGRGRRFRRPPGPCAGRVRAVRGPTVSRAGRPGSSGAGAGCPRW